MNDRCYKCLQILGAPRIHGLHKECFQEWFGIDGSRAVFSLTMKTAGNSDDPLAHLNSSFYHGKFKKYSAKLGNSDYIVKVQQEPFLDLPAMEFLCNQIARSLGLVIPDFYLIRLEDHVDAFISKNFMEGYAGANLVHFYRFMENKPFDLKHILEVILTHTHRSVDVEQFIQLCLFDMLIGNHDRHGRNLALIQTSNNGKILSPFYDNPSCLGIEDEGFLKAILEPCGKIYSSRSTEPKMWDYAIDFCELGYAETVSNFFLSIALISIVRQIEQSFISAARKAALQQLIQRRYQELKKAVNSHATSIR